MAANSSQAVSDTSQLQENTRLRQEYSDLELASRMQMEELLGITIEFAEGRGDLQQGEATSTGTGSGDNFPSEEVLEEFHVTPEADAISARNEKFARSLSQLTAYRFPESDDAARRYTLKGKSLLLDEPASMERFPDLSVYEEVEETPPEACKICFDAEITLNNSHCVNDRCNHRFCSDCLRQHAESIIKFTGSWQIPDPMAGCADSLSIELCQFLLTEHELAQSAQRQVNAGNSLLFDEPASRERFPDPFVYEEVEETSTETCKICFDVEITLSNSHCVSDRCNHRFCGDCLRLHAESVVKSTDRWQIRCPEVDCAESMSMELCQFLLTEDALAQMEQRQVEHLISPWERVYCPYEDCSCLQIRPGLPQPFNEPSGSQNGGTGPVECNSCHRLFCLECEVPWHPKLTCEENESLTDDQKSDLLLLRGLAKDNNWQRCACGHLVEQNQGCNHMQCRCGNEFCYICGGTWSHDHICDDQVTQASA